MSVDGYTFRDTLRGDIMETFVGAIVLIGLGLISWGFITFVIGIGKALKTPPVTGTARKPTSATDEIDGMNNGDYYNGPHGYSPMTGYPETQYGSGFNEDAEWNHEEQD